MVLEADEVYTLLYDMRCWADEATVEWSSENLTIGHQTTTETTITYDDYGYNSYVNMGKISPNRFSISWLIARKITNPAGTFYYLFCGPRSNSPMPGYQIIYNNITYQSTAMGHILDSSQDIYNKWRNVSNQTVQIRISEPK